MASLALLVTILFLIVLFIGPATYILSRCRIIPKIITDILGLLSILIGIWFILLPIPSTRFLGLIPIFLGYKSIQRGHNASISHNDN